MKETFLSGETAATIREALLTDGTFSGTEEWADHHGFDLDEYHRYLDFGVQLAEMYAWRSSHETCPPMVEAKGIISKGMLDKKGAKLTVEVRGKTLAQVEPFIEEPVVIQIYPEQMPLPFEDGVGVVDIETGEVVDA